MLEELVASWEKQLNNDLIEQRDILEDEENEIMKFKTLYHKENEKNKSLENELDQHRFDQSSLNLSQSTLNNSMDASLTMSLVESTVSDIKHLSSPESRLIHLTNTIKDFQQKLSAIEKYKEKLYKTCLFLKSRANDLNEENKFLRKRVISLTDRFYVVCRISPLKQILRSSGDYSLFSKEVSHLTSGNSLSNNSITVDNKTFNFDSVLTKEQNEHEIYKTLINPFISANFAGASICYVTYGQTGSGKSYTINQLFDCYISKIDKFYSAIKIRLNYKVYEIYNNKLNLLTNNSFAIGENVDTIESIKRTHERVNAQRRNGSNKLNSISNRSHTIFQINLSNEVRCSKDIFFIDLAGSEKNKFSNTSKESEKETICINESLSNLKLLIREIKRNRIVSGHKVSALNKFMVDNVIKTNTKFVFIGTVSESFLCYKDTLNTLKFMEDLMSVTLTNLKGKQTGVKFNTESKLGEINNRRETSDKSKQENIKMKFGNIMKRFDKAKQYSKYN
eukprot:GAHX01002565.1.p1 GENE.GAHX01002565.1~~GAHX01002565.1.p1  ORF type:complete len:507 (+),score=100.93 GAHX01002565.1:49-1569(+)